MWEGRFGVPNRLLGLGPGSEDRCRVLRQPALSNGCSGPRVPLPRAAQAWGWRTESIDILRYLEEQFPEPSLYPTGDDARKEVEAWMNEATENHIGVIKT